jgi:hypothetical protein
MGLGVEGVVDRGVVGEESLGWSWQVIGREQIVARSGALDSDIMQASPPEHLSQRDAP